MRHLLNGPEALESLDFWVFSFPQNQLTKKTPLYVEPI